MMRCICGAIVLMMIIFPAFGMAESKDGAVASSGDLEEKSFRYFLHMPFRSLDPAMVYYETGDLLLSSICEPLYGYHYLKRPYETIPKLAKAMPTVVYYGKDGKELSENASASEVVRVVYEIELKRDVKFHPHPCFAKDDRGNFIYSNIQPGVLRDSWTRPIDFEHQATRRVTAHDFVNGIRRLADKRFNSAAFLTLRHYVLGMEELRQKIALAVERQLKEGDPFPILVDYLSLDCTGVVAKDDYTLQITLKKKYPQIIYWLAEASLVPVPPEVVDFYGEPEVTKLDIYLDRWPVGTGPYRMDSFRPTGEIVLVKNPFFREALYPKEGAVGDKKAGVLKDAGKRLPLNDKVVVSLERDAIVRWDKFFLGDYDEQHRISGLAFEGSVSLLSDGGYRLAPGLTNRGISLVRTVSDSVYGFGFNMEDEVVGGFSPERKKLRQALSIALDYNEFIEEFQNGRGVVAQGPIPPNLFGYVGGEEGMNSYVSNWNSQNQRSERKSLQRAKLLLAEAGYPDGQDVDGNPLVLRWDYCNQWNPEYSFQRVWLRKRFGMLGVELRMQGLSLADYAAKISKGEYQLYRLGWLGDYPDPENFLSLYYGANCQEDSYGENLSKYRNPAYDKLFEQFAALADGPERMVLIRKMVKILQEDCPKVWGYHPILYGLSQKWCGNYKIHPVARDWFQYINIDPLARKEAQRAWKAGDFR